MTTQAVIGLIAAVLAIIVAVLWALLRHTQRLLDELLVGGGSDER